MLLAEYYIVFKTIKAIKGQALPGDLPVCSGVKAKGRGVRTDKLVAMKYSDSCVNLSEPLYPNRSGQGSAAKTDSSPSFLMKKKEDLEFLFLPERIVRIFNREGTEGDDIRSRIVERSSGSVAPDLGRCKIPVQESDSDYAFLHIKEGATQPKEVFACFSCRDASLFVITALKMFLGIREDGALSIALCLFACDKERVN
ncbi:hypothetical protein Tco_0393204 [Tanacetum coccineum]